MAAQHPKPKSNILVRNKTSLRSCGRKINAGESEYLHEHFLFYLELIDQKAHVIFKNRLNIMQKPHSYFSFKKKVLNTN